MTPTSTCDRRAGKERNNHEGELLKNVQSKLKLLIKEEVLKEVGPLLTNLALIKPALIKIYKDKSYPLHMRAFAKYLLGDTNVFTEKNLTQKEKKEFSELMSFIKERRIEKSKGFNALGDKIKPGVSLKIANRLKKGYFTINYTDYPRRQQRGAPQTQSGLPMTGGDFAEQIERFIGKSGRIAFTDDYFIVHDIYDFSQIDKENIDSLVDALINFIDLRSLTSKGLYIKIRKLAPYVGKPFDVRIKLDNPGSKLEKPESNV